MKKLTIPEAPTYNRIDAATPRLLLQEIQDAGGTLDRRIDLHLPAVEEFGEEFDEHDIEIRRHNWDILPLHFWVKQGPTGLGLTIPDLVPSSWLEHVIEHLEVKTERIIEVELERDDLQEIVTDRSNADSDTLDAIHRQLDGIEWDAGTIAEVADILNRSGRTVTPPAESEAPPEPEPQKIPETQPKPGSPLECYAVAARAGSVPMRKHFPRAFAKILRSHDLLDTFEGVLKTNDQWDGKLESPVATALTFDTFTCDGLRHLVIGQGGKQNGDFMRDPEVRFILIGEDQWAPFAYRNDYLGIDRDYYRADGSPIVSGNGLTDINTFLGKWAKILTEEQGFLKTNEVETPAEPAPTPPKPLSLLDQLLR
jgi:hypothetical protein